MRFGFVLNNIHHPGRNSNDWNSTDDSQGSEIFELSEAFSEQQICGSRAD